MSGCGTHNYDGFTQAKIDAVLKSLTDSGADGSGNNPWDVDTHEHGVKMHAVWTPESGQLAVTVTSKDALVPCGMVWAKIDSMLKNIQQEATPTAA
jgi:hypothetical protein